MMQNSFFKPVKDSESGKFRDMREESIYLSPKKQQMQNVYKNQSLLYQNLKIESMRAFENGDKFYSAQKEAPKGKSHDENNEESSNKDYKELINTFKNYQGKRILYD